jgi:hypothetical protein
MGQYPRNEAQSPNIAFAHIAHVRILSVKRTSLSSCTIDPGSENLGERVLPFIHKSILFYMSQIIIGNLGVF